MLTLRLLSMGKGEKVNTQTFKVTCNKCKTYVPIGTDFALAKRIRDSHNIEKHDGQNKAFIEQILV